MKSITYNVRNEYDLEGIMNGKTPWELFDHLGELKRYCAGISSPQMKTGTCCVQNRDSYDLWKYRKGGNTPTVSTSKRRGYTAIIFEMN